jgi:hypothetical protein
MEYQFYNEMIGREMKTSLILYLFLFLGIIVFIVKSTHLLDEPRKEGYNDLPAADPVIAKGIKEQRMPIQAQPNSSVPGTLPFGPYAQTASVGSYQFKDPSLLPGDLKQMKQLSESIRSFLVFEGASVASSSDPTVSLPLTQLRADYEKLAQEIAVLDKNPGIDSTMSQQDLADTEGTLTFLRRKVRLFQSSGVVSEGFEDMPVGMPKTKASKDDLQNLQNKIYAAILNLSASGTVDPVVQSRIKNLQSMYTDVTDMLSKLDKGIWSEIDIPVYKEDIQAVLPQLDNPGAKLTELTGQGSGKKLNPVEKQLAGYVGEESATDVFNYLKNSGMFRVTVDMGYNVPGSPGSGKGYGKEGSPISIEKTLGLKGDGSIGLMDSGSGNPSMSDIQPSKSGSVDGPYDSSMSGMDDRADVIHKKIRPGRLDWKKRSAGICDQVRLRGLDPLDFGCIPEGSQLSPAYSWRGHTKMVCGRLGATADPGLPETCGCPPPNWKGWTLAECLSPPPPMGQIFNPSSPGPVSKTCGENDFT